jgi:hypothetical protein
MYSIHYRTRPEVDQQFAEEYQRQLNLKPVSSATSAAHHGLVAPGTNIGPTCYISDAAAPDADSNLKYQLSASFTANNPLNNREIPLNAACAFKPTSLASPKCVSAPITVQEKEQEEEPTAPTTGHEVNSSSVLLVSPIVRTRTNESTVDDDVLHWAAVLSSGDCEEAADDRERPSPTVRTALTCVSCLDGYELVSQNVADAYAAWNNLRAVRYPVIPCLRENVELFLGALSTLSSAPDNVCLTDLGYNNSLAPEGVNGDKHQYVAVPYQGEKVAWETPVHIHAQVTLNVIAPTTGIALSSWSKEALLEAIEIQVDEFHEFCANGERPWLSLKDLQLISSITPQTGASANKNISSEQGKDVNISVTFMPSLFIPHHWRSQHTNCVLQMRFVRPVHAKLYADDVFVIQTGPAYLKVVQLSGQLNKKSIKPRQPQTSKKQQPSPDIRKHQNHADAANPVVVPLRLFTLQSQLPKSSAERAWAAEGRPAWRVPEGHWYSGTSLSGPTLLKGEYEGITTELLNNYFGGADQDAEEFTIRAGGTGFGHHTTGPEAIRRIQHRLPQSLVPTVSKLSQRWYLPAKDEEGNDAVTIPLSGKDTEGKLIVIVIELSRALITREELMKKNFVILGPDTRADDENMIYQMECTGNQLMKDTWAWVSHYQVVPPSPCWSELGHGRDEQFVGMLPSDGVSSLTIENVKVPLRATIYILTPSPLSDT